jgi:hypothetical protein
MESELILRIHGTNAASPNDIGEAWWQLRSPFERALRKRLGGNFDFSISSFHWSGKNKESHRRIAAEHLLYNYLILYEKTGVNYHLIAHSHGGNIVLNAIEIAAKRNIKLDGLRSWTTVGTPFLHFQSSSTPIRLVVQFAITSLLLVTIGTAIGWLLFTSVEQDTSDAFSTALFTAFLTWLLFTVPVLFSLLFLKTTGGLLRAVSSLFWSRTDGSIEQYREPWLGVWSKYDEAIIAIAYANRHASKVLPILFQSGDDDLGISSSDNHKLTARRKKEAKKGVSFQLPPIVKEVATFPFSLAWHFLGKRIAAKVFASQAGRIASGNDVSSQVFTKVTLDPFDLDNESMMLSEEVENELLRRALETFGQQEDLRSQLVLQETLQEMEGLPFHDAEFGGVFSGLIHCGYFANDRIVDLIQSRIKSRSKVDSET